MSSRIHMHTHARIHIHVHTIYTCTHMLAYIYTCIPGELLPPGYLYVVKRGWALVGDPTALNVGRPCKVYIHARALHTDAYA